MRKTANDSGNGATNGVARARSKGGAARRIGAGEAQLVVLPVAEKETEHPCFDCAKCCHYVAIEIDRPTTNREFDYLLWYLYHPGLGVFVDWEGHWFVNFEGRCQHLTSHGLCGIYTTRPGICRDFDWQECEMHVRDDPPDKWLFETAEQFLEWLERQRPKAFARFRAWRRERQREKPVGKLGRVKITKLSAGR
jgi:Fe-S-cluster containining protein